MGLGSVPLPLSPPHHMAATDCLHRTTVSVRNVRSAGPKVSRSDRIALVSSAELIERTIKKFTSRRNQIEKEYQQDLQKMRACIHLLPFSNVDRDSVRSSGIRRALMALTEGEYGYLELPIDIILDAESILKKWGNADFDPALLKGIELAQTVKRSAGGGKKNTKRSTHYKLEDGYPFKKNPQVVGHNGLIIGDWWPLQICALRDGAHGEMEAGKSQSPSVFYSSNLLTLLRHSRYLWQQRTWLSLRDPLGRYLL